MNGLIVPIDVASYCIGTLDVGTANWFAGASTDFRDQARTTQGGFLGTNVTRAPDDSPLWPLEAGVHLHWAMPDALAHAPANGSSLTFPALPTRWLVSRIVGAGRASKHWIIESDTLSTTSQGGIVRPTVPVNDTQNTKDPRGFRYLGVWQVFDGNWQEPQQPAANTLPTLTGQPLHAVATGDIAFAAFYPNSRGVFGFHDDLTDVTDVPAELMYVVAGWYGTPANDPLSSGLSVDQLQQQLGWTFTSKANTPLTWSVYSGSTQRIEWNPATRYVDVVNGENDKPLPIDGDVAIGNHPAEALAAYFRGKNHPDLKGFEELLTLFASGQLPSLAAPAAGQLAQLEETLHELQFTGTSGGTIYTVTRGRAEATDLPLALADALNLLNAAQQALDAANQEVRDTQWQLFADWTRIFEVDPKDQNLAFNAFNAQFKLQPDIAQNLTDATTARDTQKAAVQNMLSSDLTLTEIPAPRYCTATEPVILLAGDAAAPALRYGGDGRYHPSGFLVCRLDTDLLQTLSIGPSTTLQAGQYATLAPATPNHLPNPAIGALVEEAALLNTAIAAAATGIAAATLAADLDTWLEGGQAQYYRDPAGVPPSPVGVAGWPGENPWCSLFMLWDASFHPLLDTGAAAGSPDYPPGYFTSNYQLDPNDPRTIAYQPSAGGIVIDPAMIDFDTYNPRVSGSYLYQGAAVLSPASADNLRDQLASYLAHTSDATLQTIADELAVTDVAMQGLSGFNDALLTQQRSLQLSIGVSSDARLPFRTMTQQILSVITDPQQIAPLAPLPNGSYSGVRAGYLKLSLSVMDPFGRKRPVNVRNLYVAESLTAVSNDNPVPGIMYAQPRLAQPSRLLWRWLAADTTGYDETNAHPATTPVCGWLLPSHLSKSFFFYNAQGTPLGSLSLRADGSGLMWQSAPGDQTTVGADLATVMQHENPHLQTMANALNASPARFRAFWEATDAAVTLISPTAPDSQSSLSVLVGRPLALVQSSLKLERRGFATPDQTYASLATQVLPATDHATGDVQFPIVVGDLQRLDDGLVGYFKSNTSGVFDTSVFFSEGATGSDPGVVKPDVTNLLLTPLAASPSTPSAPQPETKLLMLVDPRAAVHATMGILPTQTLSIPAEQYEDVLAGLEFTFPVLPVLRPLGGVTLPLPTVAGYNQSWITEQIDAGKPFWAVESEIQAPAAGAVWQFSPQSLDEGSLRLNPEMLRFGVDNAQGVPVVSPGKTTSLTVTVSNRFRAPITFEPGQTISEDEPNTGSVFYVHFGSLVAANNVAAIRFSAPGWNFLALDDKRYGNYWAATPLIPVTIAPGDSLTIALTNVAVSEDVRAQARLYFDYDNLVGCSDGVEEALLTVSA
ncbi:hypothetical protein [Burkholderia ubonensis]|uniref:hypothetical protein n=1 Tax=Burkholderia ubonensis TaxID=101571 RepID=UPI000B155058|nr:hypothetical protein [Burkholderia ubonensis]